MKIRTFNSYCQEKFGTKVYKLSLSTGCSCPNRDGKAGTGGCTFCSEGGSGEFASPFEPLNFQIEKAKKLVDAKVPHSISPSARRYVAYFQSFSNTYTPTDADFERVTALFKEAALRPEIVALAIGTRPDCLEDRMINVLAEINRHKPVWIELGLQTVNKKTAQNINRGYTLPVFEKTYNALKSAGLEVVVHVIIGLPGESEEDVRNTVKYLAGLVPPLDGVKLANLQVLKGTEIGKEFVSELREDTKLKVLSLEEYGSLLIECLKLLPPQTVIHRITGDGPKNLLIEPKWSCDKKRVINYLNKLISEA